MNSDFWCFVACLLLTCIFECACDEKIRIFSTVNICLPSDEVAQKYLSLKIANIANYEVYVLRPNCCSDLIHYDDTPDNIHLLEFNSTSQHTDIREMITSYEIDLFLRTHEINCRRILTNEHLMNSLKNIPFNFSIIQTWDLCGTIISDILNLSRIDFQIESFMYPMLNQMYDFIYYDFDNIVPKSASDETFQVYLSVPYFDTIRQEFNVAIKTQRQSWDTMTKFLWIPSIPGFEYPNYLLPRIQFIGAIRSERNKYLSDSKKYSEIVAWLDGLAEDTKVILFSFGTLWHDMQELKHRDEQIFNVLDELLMNSRYHKYYIIFKSIHRDEAENQLLQRYGAMDRFRFYNYTQWIPQTIVLSHKRVQLLVCHGGYGHVQEAIYHAVPYVTIPFQFDQPLNSEKSTRIGVAYSLNVKNFTSTQLITAIEYVLNNETFYQQARAWSNAMKSYDGTSIIKFTMQTIVDGISHSFKLNIDSDKKLKYTQQTEQCKK